MQLFPEIEPKLPLRNYPQVAALQVPFTQDARCAVFIQSTFFLHFEKIKGEQRKTITTV